MSAKSSQEFIQTIVGAEVYVEGRGPEDKTGEMAQAVSFVTISRSCGSNSSVIAARLADRLHVRLYDKTLLDEIVKAAKGDKHLTARLDEHITGLWDEILQSFFSRKSLTREDYYRHLIKVLLSISRSGGVVVGRGAYLLVPNCKVFRLRLEGSLDACAQRVAEQQGIKPGKAEKIVEQVNKERQEFIKKIHKRFPASKNGCHDLVLNTDTLSPEQAVEIIVHAMKIKGFPVPSEAGKAAP